jgi:hypothetical protein
MARFMLKKKVYYQPERKETVAINKTKEENNKDEFALCPYCNSYKKESVYNEHLLECSIQSSNFLSPDHPQISVICDPVFLPFSIPKAPHHISSKKLMFSYLLEGVEPLTVKCLKCVANSFENYDSIELLTLLAKFEGNKLLASIVLYLERKCLKEIRFSELFTSRTKIHTLGNHLKDSVYRVYFSTEILLTAKEAVGALNYLKNEKFASK